MRIAIAGLGLIGGSLALALRGRYDIVGWSPSAATRARAGAAGIKIVAGLTALLPADAVIVCAPLPQVVPDLEAIAAAGAGAAVLLDVGSLKGPVAAFAERAPRTVRIVGGHPMAGTTGSGFAAADEALFRDRPFLLTPTARSDEAALALCGDIARATGAVVTVVGAEAHDRIVAALSALPLVVATALSRVGVEVAGSAVSSFAGPGFRDSTRLAATPAALAAPMLAGNAANVQEVLGRFRAALDALEAAITSEDSVVVERVLASLRRNAAD